MFIIIDESSLLELCDIAILAQLRWYSDGINIDLSPLLGKTIFNAEGTFTQIMSLIKICEITKINIRGQLSVVELQTLDELKKSNIFIKDISKDVLQSLDKPLKYVTGIIGVNTTRDSAFRLLIACRRIEFKPQNNKSLLDLLYKNADCISSLKIDPPMSIDYIKKLLPKLVNLHSINFSRITQFIVNLLGESSIKFIILGSSCISIDITPIITNPMVQSLCLRCQYTYDEDANITLLDFYHCNKDEKYYKLMKICESNTEADLLERMSNIKTPI
jgi:hypothetical protein